MKDVINQIHESEPRWFAVHTRSKSEKWVQQMLSKKKIHAWVPLQRLMRQYQRVRRVVEKPLINGYVFVKIVKNEYVAVLETENVAGFVRFSKNIIAIPEAEMDILRRIVMEEDLEISVAPTEFSAGDEVEISSGNLAGMRGRVLKVEGKKRLQVELSHLGYSLLITLDAVFLEKIHGILPQE
jgi:transcriptional antiterminator RfaH